MEYVKAFWSSAIWLLILVAFIIFCIRGRKSYFKESKKFKRQELAEKGNYTDSRKMDYNARQCHTGCKNIISYDPYDHESRTYYGCSIHGRVYASMYGRICKDYTGEQGITKCPICNFQNSYVGSIPESERCGRCRLDYKTDWYDDANEVSKIIGQIRYRGKYNENELNSEIEKRLRKRRDTIGLRLLISMKGLAIIACILIFLAFFFSQM